MSLNTNGPNQNKITEDLLEQTCLSWLSELGWQTLYGPDIAPETPDAERENYSEVILKERLRTALSQINPDVPAVGIDEAVKKLLVTDSPDLLVNNRNFHRLLTDGVDVEVQQSGDEYSETRHLKVWLVDIDNIENNDWLVVNQLTVSTDHPSPLSPLPMGEGKKHYRGGI